MRGRGAFLLPGLAGALCLGLSACVAGNGIVEEGTRTLARNAVDAAAARQLPGVPVKPFTDCVIDNATSGELIGLARAAAASDPAEMVEKAWPQVEGITSRVEARHCLLQAAFATTPAGQGG